MQTEQPISEMLGTMVHISERFCLFACLFVLFWFSFSVALEPVLELALVDQASLKLRDLCVCVLWDFSQCLLGIMNPKAWSCLQT